MKTLEIVFAGLLLVVAMGAVAKAPNDAQIVSIVVTANQVDVDAGRLAVSRSRSDAVRAFAWQMVAHHSGVGRQGAAPERTVAIAPEDNPTSQSLKKAGQETLKKLKALKGTPFDRAYIDHVVAHYTQLIETIDNTLIPNAVNSELKRSLLTLRLACVGHLEHARYVWAVLDMN
jgi:putative membrane protein